MSANYEKEAIEDLKRRKGNFRQFTRNLLPTEKFASSNFFKSVITNF